MEILDEQIDIYSTSQEKYWKLFIGNNPDYYIKKWHEFERQDSRIILHFPALFLNIHWLGYRKLYKYAVVCTLITHILSITLTLNEIHPTQVFVMSTLPYAFFGLVGNWIYYQHAQKKINEILKTHADESTRMQKIKATGQTNPLFPIVLILISMVLNFFTYYILGLSSSL